MLELGAGLGGSTVTMSAFTHSITVVDSWDRGWAKSKFEKACAGLDCKLQLIQQDTAQVSAADLGRYSFVHLDANKDLDRAQQDLLLAAECCTGIICVDDYLQSMWPEITWAVDQFVLDYPAWHRVMVGNHQVFLSRHNPDLREIIVSFPVVDRGLGLHLTYGDLPSCVDDFVQSGVMLYSWHEQAWHENTL
jgi:predicted O-methyltransferase YrrM